MFVPHLKSSSISFFLCLLCDSLHKIFTVLWGWDLAALGRASLLFYQVNPRNFKCLCFFILRICNQRKYWPSPRCALLHMHKKALRCKRWKRQIKATNQPTCMVSLSRPPCTGTIKHLHLHYQRCFSATFALFWKTQSPWIMPHVIPQVSLVSLTGNVEDTTTWGFFSFSFSKATTTCMS